MTVTLTGSKIRGAALAYRITLWHPELISHLFTVCVPYAPPRSQFTPLEDLVRTVAPNFTYQLQFAGGELEKVLRSKDEIKQFLCALYGGRTEDGQGGFDAEKGVLLDRVPKLKRSRLLSEEVSVVFYFTQSLSGMEWIEIDLILTCGLGTRILLH